MNNKFTQVPQAPSLLKLGACFLYETLIVLAILFVFTLPFLIIVGEATFGIKRYLLQLYLWVCVGAYFVWCWHKKGQTLAMQTWRFKLYQQNGELLSIRDAMLRYVLATFSLFLFGLGYLWAIVDAEHLFLHDRLLKIKFRQV